MPNHFGLNAAIAHPEAYAPMANPGALPPKPVPPIGPRIEEELRSIFHLLDKLTMTQCRPVPPIQIYDLLNEVASIKSMLEKLTGTKQEEEKQMFAIVPVRGLENIIVPCGTTIRAARGNKVRKFRVGDDDQWSDDEDWYPTDDKGYCVVIGVERERDDGEPQTDDGEPETDDGDIGEEHVNAVDEEGVVHNCSLQKMLKGGRDEQEPLCKKARTETTADSPSY